MRHMISWVRNIVQEPVRKGQGVVGHARDTAAKTVDHLAALTQLFSVEMQEYAEVQGRRAAQLALAVVLLLSAYMLVLALAAVLLAPCIGWPLALGALALLNLLAGGLLLLAFRKGKPGPPAPETRLEIQKDVQCLKILLNGEEKR